MTHLESLYLLPLLMHYQVITHTLCLAFQLLLLNCKAAELEVDVGPKAAETWNEQGVSRSREMSLLGTSCCRWQPQRPSRLLLTCLSLEVDVACTWRAVVQNRNT